MAINTSPRAIISDISMEMFAKGDINVYSIRVEGDFLFFDLEYRYLNPKDGHRPCWRKMSVPFLLDRTLDYKYHEPPKDDPDAEGYWDDWDIYMSQLYHLIWDARQKLEER